MTESPPQFDRWRFRLLLTLVGGAAALLLALADWYVPAISDSSFWNALVAFVVLGIASDSSFLPLPKISRAGVGSSVVFIPFLASVLLFAPPWPMVIACITGLVAQLA